MPVEFEIGAEVEYQGYACEVIDIIPEVEGYGVVLEVLYANYKFTTFINYELELRA